MSERKQILIVDDEKSIQRSLKRSFFEFPYIIFTASGSEEALSILEEKDIDLVLSDFKMPGMDGVDFLNIVQKRHPHIIRILISGYIDKNKLMDSLFQFRVISLIPKPWNEETLHNTVEMCLNLKDEINDLRLWTKLNSHQLISMFNANCTNELSLNEFISCEPGIYSGLLHLYNSEYYNGKKETDIKVIEQHFSSDSITELIRRSVNSDQSHPFSCYNQLYSLKLNQLYKKLRDSSQIACFIGEIVHPSLLNLYRYITYICDTILYETLSEGHFFVKKCAGNFVLNATVSKVFSYAGHFLKLWYVADEFLDFSLEVLDACEKKGFESLPDCGKLLFITDYYLEQYSNESIKEIEKHLVKDSVLQRLLKYQ